VNARPAKKLAILACMDTRLVPIRVLGLEVGDAHIIRNAGGIATDDAIRSLAISQRKLGTEEIVLLHHTDCGMTKFTDAEFVQELENEVGVPPEWSPGAFADIDGSVRESIRRIRESPFILHKNVRGFVYSVEDGSVREVSEA